MGWTSCWEQSLGSKEELETLECSQTWTRGLGAARRRVMLAVGVGEWWCSAFHKSGAPDERDGGQACRHLSRGHCIQWARLLCSSTKC